MHRALTFAGIFVAIAAGGWASAVYGDPVAGGTIPADTRWIIHVDVDAGRITPLWQLARLRLLQPHQAEIQQRVDMLERVTGMSLPQGLHDVTLFGAAYDESSVCICVHGDADEEKTTRFLKMDPDFRSEDYNGHTVLTWRDKDHDRLMYGTFAAMPSGQAGIAASGQLIMLSANRKVLESALDTLDGKSPALKPNSPLMGGGAVAGEQKTVSPILWIAGKDLAELPQAQSPVLSQMDAASFGVQWSNEKATTQVRVLTRSEKTAQQMQAMAEGVKATLALAASEEHATPRTKILSAAMQELAVSTDKNVVKGEWTLGIDKIEGLIDIAKQESIPAPKKPDVIK
jgi:hypothetical protein